tara:strand:+ start:197 stop:418 length:222 start_codon:yes stop_codon:yes gene_type:complete
MILGNEVSLAAYAKMLNENSSVQKVEETKGNTGLLSRNRELDTLESTNNSPAERVIMYLEEIRNVRQSIKESV